MHPTWKSFLSESGARFDDNGVIDFGGPSTSASSIDDDAIFDLNHLGLIRAEGDDTQSFLQNQVSNDVRLVNAQTSQLNSYNSAKGRALALFRLYQNNASYFLLLPNDILEPTLKRLRMFVLRSKVKLENVSDQFVRIGISGPNAHEKIRSALNADPPSAINGVSVHDSLTVIRISEAPTRFVVIGDANEITTLWKKLATSMRASSRASWALLDIYAGIPTVNSKTVEEFVPQMLNLQLVGGISFTKGCYPGQEIVARMHYLGQLKKRMYRIHIDTNETPTPGAGIYESTTDNEQSIGQIVDAQPSPKGGVDALAVLQIQAAEQRNLHLQNRNGPNVKIQALPYSFQ